MRAFLQIVRLELVAIARSKAMVLLALASVAWMFILPRIALDDGTAEGAFQMNVRYSLGVVYTLVLVSFSAVAAGTLARDREAKRLQLTMVRPARHMFIALGRIAALTIAAALFLGVSCVALGLRYGRGRTCDHVARPVLESPEVEARRLFDENMRDYPDFRAKVAEIGERDIMKYLVQYVNETYQTISKDERAEWNFPPVGDPDARVSVRIRVTDTFGRLEKPKGVFRFEGREGVFDHVNKTLVRVSLSPAAAAESSAQKPGVLSFSNDGDANVTVYPRRDLVLLIEADGFWWNLFRAWLVMSAVAAVAVSAGVFLGASLGRGVAVFCMMAMLAASVASPAALDEYPDPMAATKADRISLRLTGISAFLTSPLDRHAPVAALEAGECVEWREVSGALASGFFVYPVLFSLLAGLVMRRKLD